MKNIICLIVLSITYSSAYCQFEFDDTPPEMSESDKKTQFRHSFFQANYLTQNILIQFLEQSPKLLPPSTNSVRLNAKDLYYSSSSEYKTDKQIPSWIKQEHLVDRERKIELLDSAFKINKKWRKAIIEGNLLDEIHKTIYFKNELSAEGYTISAIGPPSQDNSQRSIYIFEFNKEYQIVAKNIGRLTSNNQSWFWITTSYVYEDGELSKEVYKKCNDIRCKKGYEAETKIYSKGRLQGKIREVISRYDNKKIEEEVTTYLYSKNQLDSSLAYRYSIPGESKILTKTKACSYSEGQIITEEEVWTRSQTYRDKRSFSKHSYDKKDRLILTAYEGWGDDGNQSQMRTEEYEYHTNKFIYRYKESLKKERGEKKLPLQYELTYTFY